MKRFKFVLPFMVLLISSFRLRKQPQLSSKLEKLHSTKLKLHYGFAITALCGLVAKAAQVC